MKDILSYRIVALIPARGGSEGLPRKNLLNVGGETLLERAIKCGTQCTFVDEVVVSTEDEEIAENASKYGAEVHYRDISAATNDATAEEVVVDFIRSLQHKDLVTSTLLVYLQPTSPLRNADHVSAALELMIQKNAWRCVSVIRDGYSPYKSLKIDNSGLVQPIFDQKMLTANRQGLPKIVRPNGAIYVFKLTDFLESTMFPIPGSIPFEMDFASSIDIDSELDIELANYFLARSKT